MNPLPPLIEAYVRATNNHDRASYMALFAEDAIVEDIGREFRGHDAIREWSNHEVFGADVTLDVLDFTNKNREAVVQTLVDGTFDRTGLPNPLIIIHSITTKGDKIVRLRCQLPEPAVTK